MGFLNSAIRHTFDQTSAPQPEHKHSTREREENWPKASGSPSNLAPDHPRVGQGLEGGLLGLTEPPLQAIREDGCTYATLRDGSWPRNKSLR